LAHQVLVDASNSILCHVMDRFDRVALRIAKDIVGVRAEHCRLPRNRFDRDFFAGLGLKPAEFLDRHHYSARLTVAGDNDRRLSRSSLDFARLLLKVQ
jgi:hypothetical protein